MEKIKIQWNGIGVRGWKCKKCEGEIINQVDAQKALDSKGAIKEIKEEENEPELRPEFIEKMRLVQKEPSVKIDDFKKHFGLK